MNWLSHFFGLDNLSGAHYGFWSGAGSDISELVLIGAVYGLLRKHNCHAKGCWRIGRHVVAGSPWCNRHHAAARVADGPVRAGTGSNPGEEGLPADGPVVPPAATTGKER